MAKGEIIDGSRDSFVLRKSSVVHDSTQKDLDSDLDFSSIPQSEIERIKAESEKATIKVPLTNTDKPDEVFLEKVQQDSADLVIDESPEVIQPSIETPDLIKSVINFSDECDCLLSDLNVIPSIPQLNAFLQEFEKSNPDFIIKFTELLKKRQDIAQLIFANAPDIWVEPSDIKRSAKSMYFVYSQLKSENRIAELFNNIKIKFADFPDLVNAFNRIILTNLLQKGEKSPLIKAAWDNEIGGTIQDNHDLLIMYSDYCEQNNEVLSASVHPMLQTLVEGLKEKVISTELRTQYDNFLTKPAIVEKLILTPHLLYELSTKGTTDDNSRKLRILPALQAYLKNKGEPISRVIIEKLAYDLRNAFADEPEKMDVIWETLKNFDKKKYPAVYTFGKTLEDQIKVERFLVNPKDHTLSTSRRRTLQTLNINQLWFNQGIMLLETAGSFADIKKSFEEAFSLSQISSVASESKRGSFYSKKESRESFMETRPSMLAGASSSGKGRWSNSSLGGLVDVLLKTKLPENEDMWAFFSDASAEDDLSIYSPEERDKLVKLLLDKLFSDDASPNIDDTVWSRAMQLIAEQSLSLISTPGASAQINQKIISILEAKNPSYEANRDDPFKALIDLFSEKPTTNLDTTAYFLMNGDESKFIQLLEKLSSSNRQKQLDSLVTVFITELDTVSSPQHIATLVSILSSSEKKTDVSIKQDLIAAIVRKEQEIRIDNPETLNQTFLENFLNAMLNTELEPVIAKNILMLMPLSHALWKKIIHDDRIQKVEKFVVNALSNIDVSKDQSILINIITNLNQQTPEFRLNIFEKIFAKDLLPENATFILNAFLVEIKREDLTEENAKTLLTVLLNKKTQSHAQIEDYQQVLDKAIVETTKKLSSESLMLFHSSVKDGSFAEIELTRLLREPGSTSQYLVVLLSSAKQKEIREYWLKTFRPDMQPTDLLSHFTAVEKIYWLSQRIKQDTKVSVVENLFKDFAMYENSEITDDQLKNLFDADFSIKEEQEKEQSIFQEVLQNNTWSEEQKTTVLLRVFQMAAHISQTQGSGIAVAYIDDLPPEEIFTLMQQTDTASKAICEQFMSGKNLNELDGKQYLSDVILSTQGKEDITENSFARQYLASLDFWKPYLDKKIEPEYFLGDILNALINQLKDEEKNELSNHFFSTLKEIKTSELSDQQIDIMLMALNKNHREEVGLAIAAIQEDQKSPESERIKTRIELFKLNELANKLLTADFEKTSIINECIDVTRLMSPEKLQHLGKEVNRSFLSALATRLQEPEFLDNFFKSLCDESAGTFANDEANELRDYFENLCVAISTDNPEIAKNLGKYFVENAPDSIVRATLLYDSANNQFILKKNIPLETVTEIFESVLQEFGQQNSDITLAQIKQIGIEFLSRERDITVPENKEALQNQWQTFLRIMQASDPNWLNAETVLQIPQSTLNLMLEDLLESGQSVDAVFKMINQRQGSYADNPLGRMYFSLTILQYISERNDSEQTQAYLEQVFLYLFEGFHVWNQNGKTPPLPEQISLPLLNWLSNKIEEFNKLHEETQRQASTLPAEGEEDNLELIRQNLKQLQQQYAKFANDSVVMYGAVFQQVFVEGKEETSEEYWKLCQHMLSLPVLVSDDKAAERKGIDLTNLPIQNLVNILLAEEKAPFSWQEFQDFFDIICRKEKERDTLGITGLIDGLNDLADLNLSNFELKRRIHLIPDNNLNWLVQQISILGNDVIDEQVMSAIMTRYTQQVMAGKITVANMDDVIKNTTNSIVKESISSEIHKAFLQDNDLHGEKQSFSTEMRVFAIRETSIKELSPEQVSKFYQSLLELPTSLYNETQKAAIANTLTTKEDLLNSETVGVDAKQIQQEIKAAQKAHRNAILEPLVLWKKQIENALNGLSAEDREVVRPVFQALFAEYAQDIIKNTAAFDDDAFIIQDVFAETVEKVAVFFNESPYVLLEKCEQDIQIRLFDDALGGLNARQAFAIEMEGSPAAIRNLRDAWDKKEIDNPRQLSYADTTNIIYLPTEKQWAIMGYCQNQAGNEPPIVEYFVRLGEKTAKDKLALAITCRPDLSSNGIGSSMMLGQSMMARLDKLSEKLAKIQVVDNAEIVGLQSNVSDDTPESVRTLVETQQAKLRQRIYAEEIKRCITETMPSPCRERQDRSANLVANIASAVEKLDDSDPFKQQIAQTMISRNALGNDFAIAGQWAQIPVISIINRTSNVDVIAAQDSGRSHSPLVQIREDYVTLNRFISSPANVASLYGSDASHPLHLADCVNALRARVPFLVKFGKDVIVENRKAHEAELSELSSQDVSAFPESQMIHIADDELIITIKDGTSHVISGLTGTEEEKEKFLEQLYQSETKDSLETFLTDSSAIVRISITANTLLVYPESNQKQRIEFYNTQGYQQGVVSLSLSGEINSETKSIKALITNDPNDLQKNKQLNKDIKILLLQDQIAREKKAEARAKVFSGDELLVTILNDLRDNITEMGETTNSNARATAEKANTILSNYICQEFQNQSEAKSVTEWVKNGLEDVARWAIGGDVAQCESILSGLLPKQSLNVARQWKAEGENVIPERTAVYMAGFNDEHGKPKPVALVAPIFSDSNAKDPDNKRQYILVWADEFKAGSEYQQAINEKMRLDALQITLEALPATTKNHRIYGNVDDAREKVRVDIEIQTATINRLEPTAKAQSEALKTGAMLYDKKGNVIGSLNADLRLEQELLYGKKTWFDVLVNQPVEKWNETGNVVAVPLLDMLHQDLLPEFMEEMSAEKEKNAFFRIKIINVILNATPQLSEKNCNEFIKHYTSEELWTVVTKYNKANDPSGSTRQALVRAMLLSPKHMSYFMESEKRQLALWELLNASHFDDKQITRLLMSMKMEPGSALHPHTETLRQIVRAAYFKVINGAGTESEEIRLEKLPLQIIKDIPKEARIHIFDNSPENFACLQDTAYFKALSKDFSSEDLEKVFKAFLQKGFTDSAYKNDAYTEKGLVAFYKNLDEKTFWRVFNAAAPANDENVHAQEKRKQWINQAMFGNPAFMRAISEDLGENSLMKLAIHDLGKLLDNVPDRYSAFSITEITQLINHYLQSPSEEIESFLTDWLFIKLQQGDLILDKSKQEGLENASPETFSNSSDTEIKLTEDQLATLGKLMAIKAFKETLVKKYPFYASNVEKLIKVSRQADFQSEVSVRSYYQNETSASSETFLPEAANLEYSLSLNASVEMKAWGKVKAIDQTLMTLDNSNNMKKLLNDYIGYSHVLWNEEINSKENPRTLSKSQEQLSKLSSTVLRLLSLSKEKGINRSAITMEVLLRRDNFALLMAMYEHLPKNEAIQRQVTAIMAGMFAANPSQFLSTLSQFDRQKEWGFVVNTLGLVERINKESDRKLTEKQEIRQEDRKWAVRKEAVALIGLGTVAGYTGFGAPVTGALLGLAAAGAVGGMHYTAGAAYDAGETSIKTVNNFMDALMTGIEMEDLEKARCICEDRSLEIELECKKGDYAASRKRVDYYKPASILPNFLKAFFVNLGWHNEPRSKFEVPSYRQEIPNIYINGTAPANGIHLIPVTSVAGTEGAEYECAFYKNGKNLYQENPKPRIKKSELDPEQKIINQESSAQLIRPVDFLAKGTESTAETIFKNIEAARNKAILTQAYNTKKDKYTFIKPVADEQMGKATDLAIKKGLSKEPTSNGLKQEKFVELKTHLSITPFLNADTNENKKANVATAKAKVTAMLAAIQLIDLTPGSGKVHVTDKAKYVVPRNALSRLWNKATGWLTGECTIEKEDLRALKKMLHEMLLEKSDIMQEVNVLPQKIDSIILGKSSELSERSEPLSEREIKKIASLSEIITQQEAIYKYRLDHLKKDLKEGKNTKESLLALKSCLSGLVTTAARIALLDECNEHATVTKVAGYCQEIQMLINPSSSTTNQLKPTEKEALATMLNEVNDESSHVSQRLLIVQLENLDKALQAQDKNLQDPLMQAERKAIAKDMWIACKTILEDYPEDANIRKKYDECSLLLGLTPEASKLDCEVAESFDYTKDVVRDLLKNRNEKTSSYELFQKSVSQYNTDNITRVAGFQLKE